EHFVLGPGGASVAPCASSASDRWYFADGGTTRDATELLALFNPFPEDAIVDLSFTTEAGGIEPEALQALVVPGRGLSVVNVGDHVVRRRAVSVSIVARSGRLVADRIQSYSGSAGRRGLALVLGTPSPRRGIGPTLGARQSARRWLFAIGLATDTVDEWLVLQNPGTHAATISVTALADGQQLAIDGLQDVRLAPGRRMAFRLGDHLRRDPPPLLVTSPEPVVGGRDLC